MLFKTVFYDGQSTQPHPVEVEVHDGLHINAEDGSFAHHWPYSELEVRISPYHQQTGQVSSKSMPNARLVIDEALFKTIQPHILLRRKRVDHIQSSWLMVSLFAVSAILIFVLFMWTTPYLARSFAKALPSAWEESLGQWASEQLFKHKRSCANAKGQQALDKLVAQLEKTSGQKVRVKVVDSPMVNAVTLPGNRILIFDGLLQSAPGPDSVAGVLAHEMGHAYARHPTEQLIRVMGFSAILTAAFGGNAGQAGSILNLHYSRQAESEADAYAFELLNQTSIDVQGLADMFEVFADLEKPKSLKDREWSVYLQSHPMSTDRQQKALQAIKGPYIKSLSNTQWQALKKICQKTKSYEP